MAVSIAAETEEAGEGIVAEINITPLTDVFLVLLIIFMVTSSVIANTGKKVDLPEAVDASSTPPKAITVTLSREGDVQVNDQFIQMANLRAHLEAELAKSEDKLVVLRGDKEVILDRAVFVLDQAQLAGAEGFALATKKVKER
jgi:biopolymer transport protein ExbD